ncbi:thiamine diphosphokinase [Cytobacillus sp. FJAT-54145]|uniref:Thiamine diphosphokinase n=1 Tax=Cytobacillus spartinae TaxID=3299023 RepID=A0ABW6K4G0_9BACI
MIINILASGPDEYLPDLTEYNEEGCIWVGVDRGVLTLMKRGFNPEKAFGDFDSVTEKEKQTIKKTIKHLEQFKPEKDETDMELALNWALQQNPKLIRLFGATGGRLDHLFANVYLLLKPLQENTSSEVQIIDQKNIMFIRRAGSYSLENIPKFKYISFVPITHDVKGLTLTGFKYPLKDRHILLGSTLCISNELIIDYGTFSFTEGILMVIRSRD